jgi:hypothetical protein
MLCISWFCFDINREYHTLVLTYFIQRTNRLAVKKGCKLQQSVVGGCLHVRRMHCHFCQIKVPENCTGWE